MKTVNLAIPRLADLAGPHTAHEFETGFMVPLPVILRTAYSQYKDEQNKQPVRFNCGEYGVLEMHGRRYKFEPTEKYRREKAGKELIPYEGRW